MRRQTQHISPGPVHFRSPVDSFMHSPQPRSGPTGIRPSKSHFRTAKGRHRQPEKVMAPMHAPRILVLVCKSTLPRCGDRFWYLQRFASSFVPFSRSLLCWTSGYVRDRITSSLLQQRWFRSFGRRSLPFLFCLLLRLKVLGLALLGLFAVPLNILRWPALLPTMELLRCAPSYLAKRSP